MSGSTVAPNSQHRAQVVGELAEVVVPRDTTATVGVLEVHQRRSSPTGVPVGEVGQVERALPGVVEGGDVVLLELRQWRAPHVVEERGEVRVTGHQGREVVERGEQLLGGVVEDRRADRPRVHGLRVGSGRSAAEPHEPAPSSRGGKSPSGVPLPSQLRRLTREALSSGEASESEVWRSCSIRKFSTATGVG